MSDEWGGLGPLYAKLGLATSAQVITARKAAAKAGYGAFRQAHLAGALRASLGSGDPAEAKLLFDAMREADPTLDLQPSDKEAQVLVGTVLQVEMNSKSALSGLTALGIVAALFGGVRQSTVMPNLFADAEQALANAQYASNTSPPNLVASKRPDDVNEKIDAVGVVSTNYGQAVAGPAAIAALKRIADYADTAHTAAATQANTAIAYASKLEEELRTYWWVVGGWSDHLRKPFRDLSQSEASLRAGAELAEKTTLPLGLFAAPALIDKVVRQDRKGRLTKSALADAVKGVDPAWRARFQPAATSHGDLLPVTLALHLSAESGDADDWQPRFSRTTGINAQTTMGALDLALQLYREIILARAFASAKP